MTRAVLVLSEDPARRKRLKEKYDEYVARCGYPLLRPGADPEYILRCKLIERLLNGENINLDAFDEEQAGRVPGFTVEIAYHAARIVAGYNSGELS